jgi:putative ABC transport system ATP-binding protein
MPTTWTRGRSSVTPSTGSEPALRAVDVYRFYRAGEEETLALRGVSLDLVAGEMVALTGPSGAGKSTLLSCLAGLDEPSGGTVWVSGHRMSGKTEAERAALRGRYVGTMSQTDNLFPHLTLLGNVRLARHLSGRTGDRDTESPVDLLDVLGIAARAHAWPDQLSGGERVRAGLAVALSGTPALLLADEPTGELDRASEARLLALLRRRAAAGCAVLVASHSQTVASTADRMLVLREGRLA